LLQSIPELVANIDQLLASLTVLFPGFLAYFVYIGLRAPEFEEIKRSHVVLILFFVLFFQVLLDLFSGVELWFLQGLFYFVLPILVGTAADISHRVFVSILISKYQTTIIDRIGILGLVDVGNVSRWQKTVKSYVEDGLNDVTKEYYVEVEITGAPGSEPNIKKGFLNGYSEDDLELIRYDDLGDKDFSGIGTPDIDESKLTQTVELIPRDKILSLRLYRVKLEDFELE